MMYKLKLSILNALNGGALVFSITEILNDILTLAVLVTVIMLNLKKYFEKDKKNDKN